MMCSLSAVRQLTFQLKRFIVFQFKTITVTFHHPPVAGWISNQDSNKIMVNANKITGTLKLVKNKERIEKDCKLQLTIVKIIVRKASIFLVFLVDLQINEDKDKMYIVTSCLQYMCRL